MRRSLRSKVLILTALLATVPALTVGWLLIDINAETLSTSGRELQISTLQDLSRTLDEELSGAENGLEKIGGILVRSDVPSEGRIQTILAIVESHERLDHATIYDKDGRKIDTVWQGESGQVKVPESLTPALVELATRDGRAAGSAATSQTGPRIPVVYALKAEDKVTGFVGSLVPLSPLQRRVDQLYESHFQGSDDALFVVDETRRVVAHTNPELAESMAAMEDHPVFAGIGQHRIGPELSLALDIERPSDGAEMVASVVGLKNRNWLAVAQQPREVVYASLNRMRRVVILTIVTAIALALAFGFLFSQRITAPLGKLVALARALARRDFRTRAEVNSQDELGLLAQTMNQAASDLQESEATIQHEAEIRNDLRRYLPQELVSKIVSREQNMQLGGSRQAISVLFADVVSFTPLAEKLPPEDVVQILNEMFTIATEIIFRHGGTVDKFIGDCVMAIWGAPSPQEDHARRALSAAEELVSWLEVGNRGWKERYGVEVQISVGVNSGVAIVGNIGSERRMEYTAIGEVVNVAARLEALARPMQILLTESTRNLVGAEYDYLSCGQRSVTGHEKAIEVFELRR